MPSKEYVKNWQLVNKWLHENAPQYVLNCIEELAKLTMELGEEVMRYRTTALRIETGLHRQKVTIDEMKDGFKEIEKIMNERDKILRGEDETQ